METERSQWLRELAQRRSTPRGDEQAGENYCKLDAGRGLYLLRNTDNKGTRRGRLGRAVAGDLASRTIQRSGPANLRCLLDGRPLRLRTGQEIGGVMMEFDDEDQMQLQQHRRPGDGESRQPILPESSRILTVSEAFSHVGLYQSIPKRAYATGPLMSFWQRWLHNRRRDFLKDSLHSKS